MVFIKGSFGSLSVLILYLEQYEYSTVLILGYILNVLCRQGRHGEFEPDKAQYSTPNFFDQPILIRPGQAQPLEALVAVAALQGLPSDGDHFSQILNILTWIEILYFMHMKYLVLLKLNF